GAAATATGPGTAGVVAALAGRIGFQGLLDLALLGPIHGAGRFRHLVLIGHGRSPQNWRPPALAASARALTRPWYGKPPRSYTTAVTPFSLARSAMNPPSFTAASAGLTPLSCSRTPFERVLTAARVWPAVSSMTC